VSGGIWDVRAESNLEEVRQRLGSLAEGVAAYELTLRTSAGATRSAAQNMDVIERQRQQGRDPFFLSPEERGVLHQVFRDVLGRVKTLAALEEAAHEIGRRVVAFYRDHIDRKQSASGLTPPVSKRTQREKDKAGRGSSPPLVNSGELRGCLTYRVEPKR